MCLKMYHVNTLKNKMATLKPPENKKGPSAAETDWPLTIASAYEKKKKTW